MDPAVQIEWMDVLSPDETPNAIVCPTRLVGSSEEVEGTRLIFLGLTRETDPVHKFALMKIEGGEIRVDIIQ
jgi:hypothetical protein